MKVAILSQDASLYSTRRLLEAGLERGHEVEVVDFLRCAEYPISDTSGL
jgi:ribosomal protein S6--L-glutamate ligase